MRNDVTVSCTMKIYYKLTDVDSAFKNFGTIYDSSAFAKQLNWTENDKIVFFGLINLLKPCSLYSVFKLLETPKLCFSSPVKLSATVPRTQYRKLLPERRD